MSGATKILMGSGGVVLPSDDQFNRTSFLSHFDGSNNGTNNVFDDGSDENHSITVGSSGTVTQGTFGPFSRVEGEWSTSFSGGATGLIAASSSDFTLDGEYTIEFFINLKSTTTQSFFSIGDTTNTNDIELDLFSGTTLKLYQGGYKTFSTSSDLKVGVWQHLAITRNGSNLVTCWVDGTALGSTFTLTANCDGALTIGNTFYGGSIYTAACQGRISNFRILKGTCLYTSNFTPPTSALTAITNTKILTCQSNRFIDNSTSAHTLTVTGTTPKVTAFTPFLTSEVYAAGTNGASVYFDQTTNSYLTASDATDFDFGTGDYTVEMWAYPNAGFNTSWAMTFSTSGVNQYWAWTDGGGTESNAGLSVYNGTSGPISGSNADIPPIGAWSHIVFQNTSGTYNWYLNGRRVYNTAQAEGHSASATGVMIGRSANYSSSFFFGGYLSDVRVVKGSCAYTNAATLTVPTAPLTKITNTKLLLNMADGQALDSSAQNNMTLIGNADTSTSQQKFGTASLALDETGDYVTLPHTNFEPFGTGNLTIECFVRFAASTSGNGQGLFQLSSGTLNSTTRGPAVGADNATGRWAIYYGTSYLLHGSIAPSTDTWYHVAYVRNSGTTKLYIDGTEILSVSDATDYTDTYFTIGGWHTTGYLLNGYLDEFRISHVARYTSNFTPATEAFPDKGQ